MQPCLNTIGRRKEEYLDVLVKDPFLNDYQKLLNSKALRRESHKTQVYTSPKNSHIRTRRIHTDEVISSAVAIASQLGLNVHLCMAATLGHDIGHTPYGHFGETVITELSGKEFRHNVFGVILAQEIERKNQGLNLTYETLLLMLNHSRGKKEYVVGKNKICEEPIPMWADKFAYLTSDANDVVRNGDLSPDQFCEGFQKLGKSQRERLNTLVNALVEDSKKLGRVDFDRDNPVYRYLEEHRQFMYNEVYPKMDFSIQREILQRLYHFFSAESFFEGVDPAICLALLTDEEANHFGELILHAQKPDLNRINHYGICEIIPYLRDKNLNFTDPNLNKEDFTYK